MAKDPWPLWTKGCDPMGEVPPPHVWGAVAGLKPARAMERTGVRLAGTRAGTLARGTAGSCPRLRPPPALPLRGTLLPAAGARHGHWHYSTAKDSPPSPQHGPRPHAGQVHPRGAPLLRAPQPRTTGEPMPGGRWSCHGHANPARIWGGPMGSSFGPPRDGDGIPRAGWVWGSACSPHP